MAEAIQPALSDASSDAKGIALDAFLDAYSQQPIEMVNGEIVVLHPTGRPDQRIAQDIYRSLHDYAEDHKLGEAWIETPYLLDADDRADWVHGSRVPDVSFVSQAQIDEHDKKYDKSGPWRLPPELAVEVVSPTDRYTDVTDKVVDYLRFGVKSIWVINPSDRTIRIFTPDQPDGHTLHDGDTLSADPALPGWSMAVTDMFGVETKASE